ncbi:MAG: ABC transporter permease [Saprospiraceae bacterium]|nr:ABC transporter permease [Saprospiraceae bacterium]
MKTSLLLKISKTHLLSRLRQPLIAALGVTFGIGTFIVLVSFMTGLNGLLDGLILNRTPHVHIYKELKPTKRQALENLFPGELNIIHSIKPKNEPVRIAGALQIIDDLKEREDVRGVTPQVDAQVFYVSGNTAMGGVASGVIVENELSLFHLEDYIIEGNAMDLVRFNNSIIIGAEIAKTLLLEVGDRINIRSSTGAEFALRIVGFYQSGLAEIDKIQSYVTLRTAQVMMGEGSNYITDINVKLYDIADAPPLAKVINSHYNLTATDIQTANSQFEAGTTIRNLITYAVSITLLIVAGFGIYNILNMLIYEKMNDIAILKAVGYTGRDVNLIFISQALIIGFVGGISGLLIGYFLSAFIDRIPFEIDALPTIKTYPVNFDPNFYIIGFSFAMISTFLAGFLPSRKAKDVDPVEIIRGQ